MPNTSDYMSGAVTVRMEQNVGVTDRQVRTVVGALAGLGSLGILAEAVSLPELLSPALGVIAIIMLGTAATGTCGLYSLVGADTCSMNADSR